MYLKTLCKRVEWYYSKLVCNFNGVLDWKSLPSQMRSNTRHFQRLNREWKFREKLRWFSRMWQDRSICPLVTLARFACSGSQREGRKHSLINQKRGPCSYTARRPKKIFVSFFAHFLLKSESWAWRWKIKINRRHKYFRIPLPFSMFFKFRDFWYKRRFWNGDRFVGRGIRKRKLSV